MPPTIDGTVSSYGAAERLTFRDRWGFHWAYLIALSITVFVACGGV